MDSWFLRNLFFLPLSVLSAESSFKRRSTHSRDTKRHSKDEKGVSYKKTCHVSFFTLFSLSIQDDRGTNFESKQEVTKNDSPLFLLLTFPPFRTTTFSHLIFFFRCPSVIVRLLLEKIRREEEENDHNLVFFSIRILFFLSSLRSSFWKIVPSLIFVQVEKKNRRFGLKQKGRNKRWRAYWRKMRRSSRQRKKEEKKL